MLQCSPVSNIFYVDMKHIILCPQCGLGIEINPAKILSSLATGPSKARSREKMQAAARVRWDRVIKAKNGEKP